MADKRTPETKANPGDDAGAGAPRTDDGLRPVINEMIAAAAAFDSAKEKAIGERLRPAKTWWTTEFGDDLGGALYTNYVSAEELGSESISNFFGAMQRQGKTEINIVKIEGADDKNGNAFQQAALKAMKKPVTLYTVRVTRPGEPLGTTLWSLASIDGEFRYVGRMHPVLSTLRDTILDELPMNEVASFPLIDWAGHIAGKTDPSGWDAAAKDAVGMKAALLTEAKGKRLFLVLQTDGRLVARTIDGALSRELASGYEDVTFEPRLDLVWLGKDGRVDALDLREESPTPRRIVTLPKGTSGQIMIRWNLDGNEGQTDMANGFGAGDLTWAENPKFERADLEGDSRGYKLVGRKWLVGQLERRMNQLPTAGFPTTGGPLACDGCAQSVPFGDSGLSLVPWIIPDLDGKGRFRMDYEHERQCQLYDPGKKQLGRVAGMFGAERRALSWTVATCGAYDFDPSGRAVLTETSACDETGCVTIDGYTEGWLIGSVEVELPRP